MATKREKSERSIENTERMLTELNRNIFASGIGLVTSLKNYA